MGVNTLEDLMEDQHLKDVGMFAVREHPTEGRYVQVRPPVVFSARPDPSIGPAPLLGEHSDELARELGAE
jgi:crotonobetainyl-CoA:carnitine CoA-transferase CaiB-like acyl-CoA transferase